MRVSTSTAARDGALVVGAVVTISIVAAIWRKLYAGSLIYPPSQAGADAQEIC